MGGYDSSRFLPNDISFTLAPDSSRDLVVGVQSITSLESNGTVTPLYSTPHLSFIDSTFPYIYMPNDACKAFERNLGLKWNSTFEMYIVDDELHEELITRSPTFKFTIGNAEQGGQTVEISLPYEALDLTYKSDFNANPIRYFPLRRADNDTQTTLGRAFLQEAYVITDYDHSNFSVSQCIFDDQASQKIVPMPLPVSRTTDPPNNTTQVGNPSNTQDQGKKSGSRNTTAISFASIAGILILVSVLYIYLRYRLKKCRDRYVSFTLF